MNLYNINDLTCFHLFLYVIICAEDDNIKQFDYIDFYPKISFNKEEFIESIKENDIDAILNIAISYDLYKDDFLITKKVSKEIIMPISAGENLLEKINVYLAIKTKPNTASILSIKPLLKEITKACFLLNCFQYNDRYQIF